MEQQNPPLPLMFRFIWSPFWKERLSKFLSRSFWKILESRCDSSETGYFIFLVVPIFSTSFWVSVNHLGNNLTAQSVSGYFVLFVLFRISCYFVTTRKRCNCLLCNVYAHSQYGNRPLKICEFCSVFNVSRDLFRLRLVFDTSTSRPSPYDTFDTCNSHVSVCFTEQRHKSVSRMLSVLTLIFSFMRNSSLNTYVFISHVKNVCCRTLIIKKVFPYQ